MRPISIMVESIKRIIHMVEQKDLYVRKEFNKADLIKKMLLESADKSKDIHMKNQFLTDANFIEKLYTEYTEYTEYTTSVIKSIKPIKSIYFSEFLQQKLDFTSQSLTQLQMEHDKKQKEQIGRKNYLWVNYRHRYN